MNPRSKITQWKGKAVILLAGSLLALPAGLSAQDDLASELARLRAENARLREQVATTQAPAPAQEAARPADATQPAISEMPGETTATRTTQAGQEIVVLSPFEVSSAKDYGYLKTNAVTASRIGMDIQNTPISISVMSEEFIADTGLVTITDIFRYQASGSPDASFAGKVPSNEATPQGNFTLRGFKVNSLLRNGVFRYSSYNLDNVDRVEVVKGPAAVFFGQGYPGGVVNYITKTPVFGDIPSKASYYFGNNGTQGVKFDSNQQLSEKVAFRVVGAWHDDKGPQDGQYYNGYNITPSITYLPLDDGSLKIDLSLEYLDQKQSANNTSFGLREPDQWFKDYSVPPDALMRQGLIITSGPLKGGTTYVEGDTEGNEAKYRARILRSAGNWNADVRAVSGNPDLPWILTNDVRQGARYYDASGNLTYDEDFNWTDGGAYSANRVITLQASVEWSPTEWFDARYVYTQDSDRYDAVQGRPLINADFTFDMLSGAGTSGYYRDTQNNQLDLIFKKELLGIDNKLLIGGTTFNYFQQYNANGPGPVYWEVPGFNTPENAAWKAATNQPDFPSGGAGGGGVPPSRFLVDRNGNIRTPEDIYRNYDPGVDIRPDISLLYPQDRTVLDGYKPENEAYYANWQGVMLDDRLTLMAGYRWEKKTDTGQWSQGNPPWFQYDESTGAAGVDASLDPLVYGGTSFQYAGTNFLEFDGDSYNLGASFKINDSNNIYITYSKTFKINSGTTDGFFGSETFVAEEVMTDALEYAAWKGEDGFDYLGSRIRTPAEGIAALKARGAFEQLQNEEGFNYEIGWKTQMNDNKLVGTVSIFQGVRDNEKIDDTEKQATVNEPYNRTTELFSPGPTIDPETGISDGAPLRSPYYNTRNFRWRTTGIENTITGAEFEFIYTPIPNFQAVINGAYLWQAETTTHPTYVAGAGGVADIYLGNRIENVPEIRFNFFGKYTFTETAVKGLSLGLGFRYSSETTYSRSTPYNPDQGGFMAGDYAILDANISYPWSVGGLNIINTLQVTNLLDEVYYEGSFNGSSAQTWRLYTTFEF